MSSFILMHPTFLLTSQIGQTGSRTDNGPIAYGNRRRLQLCDFWTAQFVALEFGPRKWHLALHKSTKLVGLHAEIMP